ncbi:MAG: hypothetical protein ACRDOK_04350 [Streptosporangiaceae bacterium]
MERDEAVAVRTQHLARPGRRAVVVRDLASLRGPARGTVVLPLWLYWSPPGRVFDLGKPHSLQAMYQFVLGEADNAEDLTAHLNADLLAAVWPNLFLPKGVRRAWEEHHPELCAGAAA